MTVMCKLLHWLFGHGWVTTHTNRWMAATRQECRCGAVRTFEFYQDWRTRIGMPWELGRWVSSDGTETPHLGGFDR